MFLIRGAIRKLVLVVYVIVGFVVASSHHYFAHVDRAKPAVSAILAVVVWPLVLLGISVHIK